MPTTGALHFATSGGHLRPSAQFLGFGPNNQEVYQGKASARGILCDTWLSTTRIPGVGEWNLTYYFVSSDWSTHGSVHAQVDTVPVRAELVGWNSHPSMHSFRHIYEFVDWQPTAPATMFLPPSAQCDFSLYCSTASASSTVCRDKLAFLVQRSSRDVCHSSEEAPNPRCAGDSSDNSYVGMVAATTSIAGMLVGGVVTAVILTVRRRQQERKAQLEQQVQEFKMLEDCFENDDRKLQEAMEECFDASEPQTDMKSSKTALA